MSTNQVEAEAALDLAAFLLRYHRSVDYGDFSDNAHVVQRIRRYCDYRFWYELEEQGGQNEDINGKFNSFQTVTQTALKEIVAHLERISQESQISIQKEAASISQRVNSDINSINTQLAEYQRNKKDSGLSGDNYKKILELMLQLENKLNSTQATIVGDVRNDFTRMINEQSAENTTLVRTEQKRVLDLMGDLEKKMDHRSLEQMDDLRKEINNMIA